MEQDKDILGKKGEDLACTYLAQHGFTILHRNWHFGHKEIDIVASKDDVLHIVEVKTRTGGYCEDELSEAVGRRKQKNLISAAEAYIIEFNIEHDTQFDLFFIILDKHNNSVEYIPNAFGAYES